MKACARTGCPNLLPPESAPQRKYCPTDECRRERDAERKRLERAIENHTALSAYQELHDEQPRAIKRQTSEPRDEGAERESPEFTGGVRGSWCPVLEAWLRANGWHPGWHPKPLGGAKEPETSWADIEAARERDAAEERPIDDRYFDVARGQRVTGEPTYSAAFNAVDWLMKKAKRGAGAHRAGATKRYGESSPPASLRSSWHFTSPAHHRAFQHDPEDYGSPSELWIRGKHELALAKAKQARGRDAFGRPYRNAPKRATSPSRSSFGDASRIWAEPLEGLIRWRHRRDEVGAPQVGAVRIVQETERETREACRTVEDDGYALDEAA